jgi:CRISPR-associated endonuclease/helicase Cas3
VNVILINESSGKAWIRTRRILSHYLPQIGSRTWAGQLSQSGLDQLRQKLKEAASKSAAIACHRIVTRSRMELEWTVGSTTCFAEDGRFAFRQVALQNEHVQVPSKSSTTAFAIALLRLAALFHDLGKASIAFQEKLKKGQGAEVVRHDLLSFCIVAESLCHLATTERSWLEVLVTSPERAAACVSDTRMLPAESKWLARIQERLNADRGILLSRGELTDFNARIPGLLSVLWLVLTHHRLPAGDDLAEQLDAERHLNFPDDCSRVPVADLAVCLVPYPGQKPWQDARWLTSVSTAARAAVVALEELDSSATHHPPFFWPQLCAHLLRPALILSDHIGSMQAEKGLNKTRAFGRGQIWANLHDRKHVGDTLAQHLYRVARLTRQIAHLTLAQPMPTTCLPHRSRALADQLPEAFRWQQQLGNACIEARAHGPVFVSIIAETGSGKTLGGVRAMHSLSGGKPRFTLALGLRSLTWQSAQAMLEDAMIPASDLTVAVGQPQTLGLDIKALVNLQQIEQEPVPGSESSRGGALQACLSNTEFDGSWLRGLCSEKEAMAYWGREALAFLSAPVLACTVDHLVSAATLLRGGDAKLFLRQASCDLLLDEIDAYTATDLQTIGKLAFIAGLHGRNVVIMSATIGPAVQEGLFAAWHAGIAAHAALHDRPPVYAAVFAANTAAPQVLTQPDKPSAQRAWREYVADVCARYAERAAVQPRRMLVLHELQIDSMGEAFDKIIYI